MTKTAPLASIVILTHDDVDYFEECLQSVRERTEVPHEIIVVDNASQAPALRRLQRLCRRPNIRLIRNAANRFFAAGNNQGIRAARGRFLVLLNADAVVGPQWLSRLIAWAEADPQVGLVAPMTNSAPGLQSASAPSYRGVKDLPKFAWVWAQAHAGRSREVHRLIAFCLLIKRELVDRVGLLDERFGPGGYEDYDYCLRARQAGYKLLLAEDVFVHHYGAMGYRGVDYSHHRRINREILARKWSQFVFHALDDTDAAGWDLRRSRDEQELQGRRARRLAAR
ncbi:MAG: glycosyltransferase family 2 protein [Elusimicrobia bacterium]|jgi:GT2 family glycosyltransferase|nr:glycosyltransferase family 2 protein [Elusimicrobiota bacterium]